MAVKLLGLGFSFSGKDKGAKKTAESLADSVGNIDKGIKSINTSARMNRLSAFIQSVSLHKLGQISDKLGDMASKAGSPELTTNLEKTFVQMEKTTAGVVAGLGMSGTEARKAKKEWASWAYQMGVGVETVSEVGAAVHQTDLDLKDYGMTVKDLVKLQETYGVSGKELVGTFKQLETTYNVTGKQAKSITDAIVAQGKALGFGKETLAGYPELTMRINKMFAKTFRKEGPKDFQKTAMGITKLGAVMAKQLGVSFESGRESAVAIFEQLTGAEVGFQKMASGLEREMPGITNTMAEVGMDMGTIFDQIRQDPVEFAQSMRKSLDQLRAMGGKQGQMALMFTQRLHSVMGELPDEFMQLMDATGGAGAQIDKMLASTNSPVKKAEGTLNDMAKAFRTGFDLDEVLSRAREQLAYTMSKISKKETREFVRIQTGAYKDIGNKITELAQDKGPLGFLIRRLSLFRKVGIAALFPMSDKGLGKHLGALAPLFAGVASKSLPFLTAMGSLGMRPGQIVKPFTMLLKPLTMMYRLVPGLGRSFLRIFGPIGLIITLIGAFGDDLKKVFTNVWEKATKFVGDTLPKFILKHIFGSKIDENAPLWTQVGKKVMAGLEKAWNWTIENFTKGVTIIGDLLFKAGDWLSQQPWDKYMGKVVDWLSDAFLKIGDTIWSIAVGVWDWIWGDETETVVKGKTGEMEKGAGQVLSDGIVKLIDGLWGAVKKAIGKLWSKWTGFWSDESTSFLDKIKKFGKGLMGALAVGMVISSRFRNRVLGGFKNLFGGMLSRAKTGGAAVADATCMQAAAARSCMGGGMPMMGAGAGAQMGLPLRGRGVGNLGRGLTAAAQYGMAMQMGPQIGPTRMLGRRIKAMPGRIRAGAVGAGQWAMGLPGRARGAMGRGWGAVAGVPGRIRGAVGGAYGRFQERGGMRGMGQRAWGGMKSMGMRGVYGLESLSDRALRGASTGLKKVGTGIKKVGGRLKMMGKRMGPPLRGMGKMAGLTGGILLLSGAFEPLAKKMGMSEKAASSLSGALGGAATGAMTGMMFGGPLGAAIGGLVGLIPSVIDLFSNTRWEAKRLEEQMKKDAAAFGKFDQRLQEELTHLAKAKDLLGKMGDEIERIGGMDDKLQKSKALSTLENQALSFDIAIQSAMHSRKNLTQAMGGAEQKKYEDAAAGFVIYTEKMRTELRDLAEMYAEARDPRERKKFADDITQKMKMIYRFGYGMRKAGPATAWTVTNKQIKDIQDDLRMRTKRTFGSITQFGQQFDKSMNKRSWGRDIATGFENIAIQAKSASEEMKGAVGETPRARGLPATLPGAGAIGGAAARGRETSTLIQVLQAGFSAMVGAVDRNTAESMKARSAITLKVTGKGGGREEEYALAYS